MEPEISLHPDFLEKMDPQPEEEQIDRTRIEAVEKALEERIVWLLATIEDHEHDPEQMFDVARTAAGLFGCWRSLQPELDRASYSSPFGDLIRARASSKPDEAPQEEEPNEGSDDVDGD